MNILNLIFPKKCLECGLPAQAGKPGRYLCEDCVKKVPAGGWANREVYSVWRYEGVIRKAIIALKYKFVTGVANELADCCVQKLYASRFSLFTILTPIPLHWRRQNFRGFNQSLEIGKIIAQKMGWKFIPDLLVRKKSTTPQVELKGPARRTNLRNVFSLNTKYQILNTNYVVFDDVMTTGSTLMEAAKVLKKAGVSKVWGLTLAR